MNTLATAAPSTASLRWSGHWIGHEPRAATGTPADFLTGADVAREFSRSMFRTTFDLQESSDRCAGPDYRRLPIRALGERTRGRTRPRPLAAVPAALRQLRPSAVPLRRRQRHCRPGHLLRAADVVLAASPSWLQHRRRPRLRSAARRSDARLRRQLACTAIGRLVTAGRNPRR